MAHEASPPRTANGSQPVRRLLRLLGTSRFLVLIAIICTFVAATVLLLYGAFETYGMIALLFTKADESKTGKALILAAIELVDIFLLGTVLYVIAIGLYELFIDPRVPLPAWLRINDIDDLKQKLTSVVITVLGVIFLGYVISWDGTLNLLPLGGAIALVVAALSYFLRVHVDKHDGGTDEQP